MSEGRSEHEGEQQSGPTVRDRRRIDPDTYELREPQQTAAAPGPGAGSDAPDVTSPAGESPAESISVEGNRVTELETALAERTADLQRLQAEYVNYKRRVDRDRDVSRKGGVESVLKDLLAVLDDVRSAGEHGELSGAFKAVGDEVVRITGKHGLEPFGTKGDPFDPHIHEALLHSHSADVTGPTCVEILQPGYRVGERVLRPARVAVAEPDPSSTPTETPASTEPESGSTEPEQG